MNHESDGVVVGLSNNVLHFPTGMRYREVGITRIIAKDNELADFLADTFEAFDRTVVESDAYKREEFVVTEINWLKQIEAIPRNELPTEIEPLLEYIDLDWWSR